jgi:outer membrane protein X
MNMTSIFRKAAILAIVATMGVAAFAQEKGSMAIGGNLLIAGDETTLAGVGAKFQYNITNPIRLEGSFSYFFPKKDEMRIMGISVETSLSMLDFNVNGHYLIPLTDRVTVYPLAGLGMVSMKMKGNALGGLVNETVSENNFGVNLGGGIDFKISDAIIFNVEAKYKLIQDGGIYFASAGLAFMF